MHKKLIMFVFVAILGMILSALFPNNASIIAVVFVTALCCMYGGWF